MPAELRESSPEVAEPALKKRNIAKTTNKVNDEGISECFKVIRTKFYLSLAPCHLANPINGVKSQHLEPLVMKYHPKARGVVLSYFNITLSNERDGGESQTSLVKVNDASPFAFLWATVDLLIWQPQQGDVLEGYIYMQTQSHIGLLVHDTFNASLKFKNLPQDWEFVPSQADEYSEEQSSENSKFRSYGHWVDGNGTKVEGKIKFSVKRVNTAGRMVSLEGTLVSPESELDAQPVSTERRKLSTSAAAASNATHMRFDDEPDAPEVTEIPEAAAEDVPTYEKSDDEDASDDSSE